MMEYVANVADLAVMQYHHYAICAAITIQNYSDLTLSVISSEFLYLFSFTFSSGRTLSSAEAPFGPNAHPQSTLKCSKPPRELCKSEQIQKFYLAQFKSCKRVHL